VVAVACNRRAGAGDRGLDPLLKLFGGRRHGPQG
jgi:hypothetical protein